MQTYLVCHFGCRATQADADAIAAQLRAGGFVPAHSGAAAENVAEGGADSAPAVIAAAAAAVVVVNTCTVTLDADRAARKAIRALHRANPAARIIITGCYAQRAPEELASLPGVAHVVGNAHQSQIPALAATPAMRCVAAGPSVGAGFSPPSGFISLDALRTIRIPDSPARPAILTGDLHTHRKLAPAHAAYLPDGEHTRPILKIQDGCDSRCAYCIIPRVRGRSRSLPPDDVVAAVRAQVAAGAREIVLSGINLGSYGRDLEPRSTARSRASLVNLLRRILAETRIERLRLSSVEPQDVTQELIDLVAENSSDAGGRLARHFHVPLQSGSDRILAAMHRWYRAEHYAQRIERICATIPGAAIGADVIVGFPGETDEDFAATRALIERLPFTYLHVFAFSPRPGTEAAQLLDSVRGGGLQPGAPNASDVFEVSPHIIKERSRELRAIANVKASAFRAAHAGKSLRLLTLQTQRNGTTEALSDNYLTIQLPGQLPANRFVHFEF